MSSVACAEVCDTNCPERIILKWEPTEKESFFRVQHGNNPEHCRVLPGLGLLAEALISWLREIHRVEGECQDETNYA